MPLKVAKITTIWFWSFSSKAYNCTLLINLQFFINLPEDYQLNLLWHRCLWLQTTVPKKKGSDDHNPEESVKRPTHNFNSGTVSRQASPLSVDHINNSRHLPYHLCLILHLNQQVCTLSAMPVQCTWWQIVFFTIRQNITTQYHKSKLQSTRRYQDKFF